MSRRDLSPGTESTAAGRGRLPPLPTWPVAMTIGGSILYWLAPHTDTYPAAIAALVVYGGAAFLTSAWGSVRRSLLTPLGWALLLFALSTVVSPLLIAFYGPYVSVLPALPPDRYVNEALVVMMVSLIAFCCGYLLAYRRGRVRALTSRRPATRWGLPPTWFVAACVGLGTLGMILAFGDLGGLTTYFTSPSLAHQSVLAPTTTGVRLAANILRPFLGIGLILIWCRRLDRAGHPFRLLDSFATFMILLLAVVVFGTFSYNRGSFAVPVVAILAVFSRRVHRFRAVELATVATVATILLGAFGFYRSSDLSSSELLSRQGVAIVANNLDFNHQIQIQSNSPQFLGFLLEKSAGSRLTLGRTTASAVLYPIPVLGKAFRPTSGAVIYNSWIYGSIIGGPYLGDQIVPFAGELSMDFKIPGVVLGFLLLGALIAKMQLRFERNVTAVELYVTQFTSIWISFLIIGSLEVVSQIFVYSFWPIYILAGYELLRRRSLERGAAPQPSKRLRVTQASRP